MPAIGKVKDIDSSLRFPQFNIPEEEKKEDYHKKWVQAITKYSVSSTYDMSYAIMDESYNFYNGTQTGSEFNFLQEAEDGEVLPALWINFNKIKGKVDVLIGELDKRGYNISVKAINKEAVIRKYNFKEDMRVDIRLNPHAKLIEDTYGVPMGFNPDLPETEADLDMFFEKWQDKAEVIVEYALKYIDKKYNWRYLRMSLFRDILIAGRAFVKCELVNGVPTIRRVDPRNMIFDYHATDDFLSDATFFGEIRYMNIGDAAEQYNLTEKEIKEAYKTYMDASGNTSTNLLVDTSKGSSLSYFQWEKGELRVLVLSAAWIDYKKLKKKYSEDKFGRTHVKSVSDKRDDSDKVKSRMIKTWRKGTLIGGKILKEWGEIENQIRSVDDFYESDCPYKACIPNFINKTAISKVDILKSLQKLKNITMYSIQLAMSRAGGKGFVYDIAQTPEGWDVRNVIKYLKTVGIAFIDSKKDDIPANFNQFGTVDMGLDQGVSRYIEISMLIDREIDSISGINDARQGLLQGASQAVGTTQSALIQSALVTESLNTEMQMFASNVWTHVAGLFRFADLNKFAPILSDTGINFFEEDLYYDLDDYGVFVEETNPALYDLQSFYNLVTTALQAQAIDFIDAMKLMREKDVTKGIREFELAYNKKQQQMMEAQQAAAQKEAENQRINQQDALAAQMQSQEISNEGKIDQAKTKGDKDIEKALIEGRINLRGKQLDNLYEKNKENTKK